MIYPCLLAYGADTLLITSPNLPALPGLDIDTSRGKRTTQLDLTRSDDCAVLEKLASAADVFLQAYRPGGLAAKGFGVEELEKIRPGIISANLCAWGWEGVWKDRRGVCVAIDNPHCVLMMTFESRSLTHSCKQLLDSIMLKHRPIMNSLIQANHFPLLSIHGLSRIKFLTTQVAIYSHLGLSRLFASQLPYVCSSIPLTILREQCRREVHGKFVYLLLVLHNTSGR